MRVHTLLLLLVLAIIATFAALNWNAFMLPTTLDLVVAEVHAPLGLIMIGMLAAVTALFLLFLVYLQTSTLLEARRTARELQASRGLADKAEVSRFTELRAYLELELKRLASLNAESKAAVLTRLDALDQGLRQTVEQSANSISAQIGQVEDRLETGARNLTLSPPA